MKRSFSIQNALLPIIAIALAAGTASGQMYSDISTIVTADTTNGNVIIERTEKDATGATIITGRFRGTLLFSGSSLTLSDQAICPYNGQGINIAFVAKRRVDGTWAWAKKLKAGPSTSYCNYILINGAATDAQGNSFLTGEYNGTVMFDTVALHSSTSTTPWTGRNYHAVDLFVAKMDSNGVFQWVRTEGSDKGPDVGADIAVDVGGNVVVAGWHTNTWNSGGLLWPEVYATDVYIAKYAGTGVRQWEKKIGNANFVPVKKNGRYSFDQLSSNTGYTVTSDESGNLYIGGRFTGTLNFGGIVVTSHAAKSVDAFAAKYTSNGSPVWVKTGFNSTTCGNTVDVTQFVRCALDTAGNPLFLCRSGCGGNLTISGVGYQNTSNGTLVKLGANGTAQWIANVAGYSNANGFNDVDTYGGWFSPKPRSIDVEPSGNIDVLSGTVPTLIGFNGNGSPRYMETIAGVPVGNGDLCRTSGGTQLSFGFKNGLVLNTPSGPIALWSPSFRVGKAVFLANYDPGVPKLPHQEAGNSPATGIRLSQNYPNPVSSREASTTISYSLDNDGPVLLKVYNALGREVATLVNETQGAGAHAATFNAASLGFGVYTYELTVAGQRQSRKMLLVK